MYGHGLQPTTRPLEFLNQFRVPLARRQLRVAPVADRVRAGTGDHDAMRLRGALQVLERQRQVRLGLGDRSADAGHHLDRGLHELMTHLGVLAALQQPGKPGKDLAGLPGLLESGEHPKMRHELMQSTVEVVTGICGTVAEAKADLALSLKDLQRAAESHGIVLASSGTHAMSHWRDGKMSPSQRYAELAQEMQYPSRRAQTMAVHVHVGLRDEHRAMPVINALAVYLPHLLGLSASSPFWCGADTGLACTRSVVFGSLPHTGPPLGLPDWKSFEDYMAGQLRAGTIRTIKEVWWDVRRHPDYGTVEVRIADAVA